jgi:hypothetical protein
LGSKYANEKEKLDVKQFQVRKQLHSKITNSKCQIPSPHLELNGWSKIGLGIMLNRT